MFVEIIAKIGVKCVANCADQTTSHMVAIFGLNETARVLVNACGVGILNFFTLTNFMAKNVFLGDKSFFRPCDRKIIFSG